MFAKGVCFKVREEEVLTLTWISYNTGPFKENTSVTRNKLHSTEVAGQTSHRT